MMHNYLERRGRLTDSTIKVISPMAVPVPISPEASAGILKALDERGIGWWPQSKVTRLDSAAKTALLDDGRRTGYDLFLGVPVHRAPQVVEESDLVEDGWIPVDHATFATRFEDVYAVGDVTSAPVPRVGAIAEGEARTLAEVLIHQFRGGDTPPPYRGVATCYIEFGDATVARFDANFLGGPSPFGTFTEASEDLATSKKEWAASRRQRWFGISD
jgi:sulfide:quinone oxidoreductase